MGKYISIDRFNIRIDNLSITDAGRTASIMYVVCCFFFVLAVSFNAYAEDSPLTPLIERTVSFVKPMSGEVVSVDDGVVRIGLGTKDGLSEGMRLKVLRRGGFFYHPVTQEPIGRAEEAVGAIEVLQVEGAVASCKIIEGEAKSGDIARISASKKKLLFYQEESVDYYLGDAYYKGLKTTGRFEIVDAPVGQLDAEKLLKVAASEKTDLVLILGSANTGEKINLKQTLLWPDGAILSEDSLYIPAAFFSELRFGSELLTDVQNAPLLSYDLPNGADIISAGDIDGDGRIDLVVSTGDGIIYVYNYDIELEVLYRLKMNPSGTVIRMQVFDIDTDGKDEIFLSVVSSGHEAVNSYIYKLNDQKLETLWKTDGFIRVMDGKILYQKYSNSEGYSGPIILINHQDGFRMEGAYRGLEGFNIYDFVTLRNEEGRTVYLLMDDNNHLKLIDSNGNAVWRSVESMGGFVREFTTEPPLTDADGVVWHLNDRMVKRNNEAVVIKRNPLIGRALGYKSSQLRGYRYSGTTVDGSTLVDKISGKVLDYSIFDDKVAVLSKPLLGIKAGNILRGKNPMVTILQIYSIRGR
ncbi:MAG: VCBS repeat-containing protein [Nitrospirota bacterium]|nr:VCBS repeat-containing protein [Nitrospirota bacterium]